MTKLQALVAASIAAATNAADAAAIDRIGWLAGCWRGEASGRIFEEQWMAPRAGLMLGMGRTVEGERATGYEQMRIDGRADALVFTSKPHDKPEDSFTALAGDDAGVVFENLAHPFPQRIIYRRVGERSLAARIEGRRGDRVVGIDFPMERVGCDR